MSYPQGTENYFRKRYSINSQDACIIADHSMQFCVVQLNYRASDPWDLSFDTTLEFSFVQLSWWDLKNDISIFFDQAKNKIYFVHNLHEHLRPVFQPLTPVRFSFHLPCLHGKLLKVFISQTHSGSVWKVTWAHPEFGQVLASCSFDRTAAVWEEQGKTNYICYLYYDVIFENYDWNIES